MNSMKYVYLDQNHWIALAKAAKGRPDAADLVRVLVAARDAVANRRAVFPLSSVHFMETARAARCDQRADLAALMTSLSMGVVLRAPGPLVEFQLRNATRRLFAQPLLKPDPSFFGRGVEDVFNFNFSALLNIPAERAARFRKSLDTPDALIRLLSFNKEAYRTAGMSSVDRIGKEAVVQYERRRATSAGEDGDFTRRVYGALLMKYFWVELQRSLWEIGRTFDDLRKIGFRRLMEFWDSIPGLHVELELHTQMQRQKSKPWTPNDVRDIQFLALAIPVCDVVVTEAFWVDLAQRRKLHDHYCTVLLSNLRDLPRQLEALEN